MRSKSIIFSIYFVTAWLVVTLFRIDIFWHLTIVIYLFTGRNEDMLDRVLYDTPHRILIYMSKFTPFFLSLQILSIVSFFAETSEDNGPKSETSGSKESLVSA